MTKPDKPLHKIEIIDIGKVQDKVKIHHTDYASEFHEWRSCIEHVPSENSLEGFIHFREIKKGLYSTMRDDPDSRITMAGVCRKVTSRRDRKKFRRAERVDDRGGTWACSGRWEPGRKRVGKS